MTHRKTIFISGATGRVGRQLVARLRGKHKLRLVARTASTLDAMAGPEIATFVANLSDGAAISRAMDGADIAVTMIPSNHSADDFAADQREKMQGQLEGLKNAGIAQVINLSSVGAHVTEGNGILGVLGEMERALDALLGTRVVHLRPSYFFENAFYWNDLIRHQGITGLPTRDDVALPMIATRDVARRLAELLDAPTLPKERVLPLLGARDYTLPELTRALAEAIELPSLRYVNVPAEQMKAGLTATGGSESFAEKYVELAEAFSTGLLNQEARTAESTTETGLEEFAREVFAPAFRAAG
ncbi:MAG: NAD(P)H-binding protein [Myxococcota bacterium]